MSVRELPASLLADLRRVRAFEAEADGLQQLHRAIHATSMLMLAAVDVGWKGTEIARALGMHRAAVERRVRNARARLGADRPALLVDLPLTQRPSPRRVLKTAIEERE